MRTNQAINFHSNLNAILLLVIGFFHITRGFKFLGNTEVEIITLLFLGVIFFNTKNWFLNDIKLPFFLKIYLILAALTASIMLYVAFTELDKSAFIVGYQLIVSLIYLYLVILSTCKSVNFVNRLDSLIKYYSFILFSLAFLNILMFIQINYSNSQPFFLIELGTTQPRLYEHFLTGVLAKGDSSRYISYFGEPSDFLWIMASGVFILLNYNYFFMASIIIFSIILSGSGSIAIFIPFLFVYCILKKDYRAFWVCVISLLVVYFISEGTIYRIVSRYYDINTHKISIGRFDKLAAENLSEANSFVNSFSYKKNTLVDFFNLILPIKISSNNLINYINNFFYIIFRIRIFALPFILASLFLFYLQFKNLLISRNIDFIFSLSCFILLLFCREAFCFILIFWYLFYLMCLKSERTISYG